MTRLPEGYREVRRVDVMRNRKEAVLVNLLALAITGVMIVLGFLICPSFAEFEVGLHTLFGIVLMSVGIVVLSKTNKW